MIVSTSIPEPDRRSSILYVGQDLAGHWLVQESRGLLEGRFISRDAAWKYARAEVHAFPGARIVLTSEVLSPSIPFDPISATAKAFDRAA